MPFTVTHDGGMDIEQFEAYARLLNKWGVDIANTRRAPEPGTRARWLPVWPGRADAERFAQELRSRNQDKAWQVYPLDRGGVSEGALGPINLLVGRRSDGWAYGLDPYSSTLVRRRFPHARLMHGLYIYTDTQPGAETAQASLWDQVVRIVTGLSEEQLADLGGYRVYDELQKKLLRQPLLAG